MITQTRCVCVRMACMCVYEFSLWNSLPLNLLFSSVLFHQKLLKEQFQPEVLKPYFNKFLERFNLSQYYVAVQINMHTCLIQYIGIQLRPELCVIFIGYFTVFL